MVNDDEGWSMVIHSDLGISIVMGVPQMDGF